MTNFYKLRNRCNLLHRLTVGVLAALASLAAQPALAFDVVSAQQFPTVTLSVDEVPLTDVLKKIESQTSYTFFYNNELVENAGTVTASFHDSGLKEALDAVFAGKQLLYEFRGDKILIKRKRTSAPEQKQSVSAESGQDPQVQEPSSNAANMPDGTARPLTPAPTGKTTVVRGTVKDEEGKPMPGVGVIIKGTLTGTVTDTNGAYAIKARPNDELSFSFLGYKTQDVFVGSKSRIDITLVDQAQAIDEVVVTALGLKRDEKSLGYAATKVDGDVFASSTTSSNWLSGLTGQVAGLTLQRTGAGAGGSMRVTLRGESSLDLSNNGALFVIDGVPMFNTSSSMGESAYAIDYGDGTGDINPDDIENITVLKGPAATALYGSEAANGAIVITTKSGDVEDGNVSVTFTSNFVAEIVNTEPDLQYVYGQGGTKGHDNFHYGDPVEGGEVTTTDATSWGPKMDGTLYYQYYDEKRGIGVDENGLRVKTPFISYGNWFKDFFQTGWTTTNSISLSAKINRNNNVRLSISDSRSQSITPNSPAMRQSIKLNSRNKINKWLSMNTSITYYRRDCGNLPQMGYGQASVMYSLWCMAPNINMDWARDYWIEEDVQQNANLTGAKNNPYFVAYECLNTLDRDRVFGNTSLDLHLYQGLDLMLRGGVDFSRDHRTMQQPKSSYSQRYGMYREGDVSSLQMSLDFLLKYSRKLGAGFEMKLNFGGSIINRMFRETTKTAEQLKQPGVYSLANSVERVKTQTYDYERQTNSLYGLAQFSWRDAIFLDITGRNDWSSTLPINNNSYFYPSVSTSILLNELIDFGSLRNTFNLVKLRGSFAQVGHDTKPYRTTDYLSSSDFPGTYQIPGTMNNANLKPEIVSSWEVGLDLRMFRNRLGIDLAYYDNTSKDLIVNMPVSSASGVTKRYANAGVIRNYGWELQINGTIIKTRNVQWKAYVNWSLNRNKVVDLGEGVDSWIVASYSSHAYMTAYKGGSMSAMYGLGYKRAPEGSYIVEKDGSIQNVSGQIIVDENGYPQYSDELMYIGECLPDWKGGFGTSVKWKGLTVSIAFDGQHGGHVYSYTNAVMGTRGKGTFTLAGRYDGMVLDGVNQLADGNFIRNTHKTADIVEYYGLAYAFQNCEQNFVSTEFLKLREVRIEYEFPRALLAKSGFIKGLSLSVYGRDLYCWTKFPGWDPEGAFMRGASVVPGFEMLQMPGTATFGGSIKIIF